MLRTYRLASSLSYYLFFPFARFALRTDEPDGVWRDRLGFKGFGHRGHFDLWLHAVSVGEAGVVEALVETLLRERPDLDILVSSTTAQGYARLRSSLGNVCQSMVFPLDFPQVVRRVLKNIRVRVYGSIETELWPNLILGLKAQGTRCCLLNGRISKRSFKAYSRLRSLFSPVLGSFSRLCVISNTYKERLTLLGARADDVIVTGNAKFEALMNRPDPLKAGRLKERLRIRDDAPVFVAGSLRTGEDRPIIEALQRLKSRFPHLVIFLVPRHLDRVKGIRSTLGKRGIDFQLWSRLELGQRRIEDWIVVDVIGPLYDLYGVSGVSFVGGSLVPKGGQNLMEPASWGCPVLFGPHTENFSDAASILEGSGGGFMVRNQDELYDRALALFSDSGLRKRVGTKARMALEASSMGAASRQAGVILEQLDMAREGSS